MNNKYKGKCYVCGKEVNIGAGFFQRYKNKWLTKHNGCKPKYKNNKLIIYE